MSVKDEHVRIYDIFDRMAGIIQDLNNISQYVEEGWKLPNSLQSMLGKIYRYEGKTVSEIARIYDIDLKNTTKYVRELEKRKLIKKEKHGKSNTLMLTEEGHLLHKSLSEDKAILLDEIIKKLHPDQLSFTAETLRQMQELTREHYRGIKK